MRLGFSFLTIVTIVLPITMDDELVGLREELAKIGRLREAMNMSIEELAQKTAAAVKRSKGKIPMTEIATLVGLERTTLYRVYHN